MSSEVNVEPAPVTITGEGKPLALDVMNNRLSELQNILDTVWVVICTVMVILAQVGLMMIPYVSKWLTIAPSWPHSNIHERFHRNDMPADQLNRYKSTHNTINRGQWWQ